MEAAIRLKNVSKTFFGRTRGLLALEDIDLEVRIGEIFILLGPSGAGKSTLLRIMSGLEREYEGSVEFASGLNPKRDVSFVFQQFALLPWLTIAENVELGLLARKVSKTQRESIAAREIKRLGLEKFSRAYPRELSGGMKQRVGIARALATNPKVIFMDEPFSELDSFTTGELRKELINIWQESKPTIVMVTHVVDEAVELADRVAVLTPRPGRIEKVVEIKLSRPRQRRSENFYELEDKLYDLIKPQ